MDRTDRRAVLWKIYERLARLAASFGAAARLMLLQLLSQGPRGVESLARLTGLSVANASQHLKRMERDGLVVARKQGASRLYRVKALALLEILERLQELGREVDPWLDEAEKLLDDRAKAIDKPDSVLRKEIFAGRSILLDVRPVDEAQFTPIPGAVTIPASELRRRLNEFSKTKPVYVVCRGRYCISASKAALYLNRKGYRAFRLRYSPYRLSLLLDKKVRAPKWREI